MAISFGLTPDSLTVNLTSGADFLQTLESVDDDGNPVDWVDGESVTLVFSSGDIWPATLTGNIASWDVDKAVVQPILDVSYPKVDLVYAADTFDAVWARGTVARR